VVPSECVFFLSLLSLSPMLTFFLALRLANRLPPHPSSRSFRRTPPPLQHHRLRFRHCRYHLPRLFLLRRRRNPHCLLLRRSVRQRSLGGMEAPRPSRLMDRSLGDRPSFDLPAEERRLLSLPRRPQHLFLTDGVQRKKRENAVELVDRHSSSFLPRRLLRHMAHPSSTPPPCRYPCHAWLDSPHFFLLVLLSLPRIALRQRSLSRPQSTREIHLLARQPRQVDLLSHRRPHTATSSRRRKATSELRFSGARRSKE
jgi:hypothetical protein